MRTMDYLARGRDNNFNLIRMVAATAVLVSHAWPIALGRAAMEPLAEVAPTNLGRLAVAVFFVVSGFFITKSFDRRESFIAFVVARGLRLFPALIVVLLLSVLLLGPLFTHLQLSDYFGSLRTWTYIPHNVLLARLQYDLPGVFAANPGGPGVNGSLWTLWYEVLCYLGVAAVGLGGFLKPSRFLIFILVYALLYGAIRAGNPALPPTLLMELSLPFLIGACFYVFRRHLRLSLLVVLVLAGTVYLLRETAIYREAFILALAYTTFWLARIDWPLLRAYNRLGDYSYGMYIFAFPIEQSITAMAAGIEPATLIVIGLAATVPCAVASWHLVENPVLTRRHYVSHRLNGAWNRMLALLRRRAINPSPGD